ncbi:MAG: nitroreductase family protein [Parachlamydiaceae bacterium]
MTTFKNRKSQYPIQPLILSRVSSRAFSEEHLSEEELMALFEAARWAPSSYNHQPWRFVYVRRGDKEWEKLFNVLVEFNQSWCDQADTLVAVISRQNFEHNNKPARTASFDAGAAWMGLALEAHARNLVAHAMEGFDYGALKKSLNIPDHFKIEAMIAIGKVGDKNTLSQTLQEREEPTQRRPIEEIVSRGHFPFK